jgi:hypothetical protein
MWNRNPRPTQNTDTKFKEPIQSQAELQTEADQNTCKYRRQSSTASLSILTPTTNASGRMTEVAVNGVNGVRDKAAVNKK